MTKREEELENRATILKEQLNQAEVQYIKANPPKTTNQQIAELLKTQTYEERMQMAKTFSMCVSDWESDGISANSDSFASLLDGVAEGILDEGKS